MNWKKKLKICEKGCEKEYSSAFVVSTGASFIFRRSSIVFSTIHNGLSLRKVFFFLWKTHTLFSKRALFSFSIIHFSETSRIATTIHYLVQGSHAYLCVWRSDQSGVVLKILNDSIISIIRLFHYRHIPLHSDCWMTPHDTS